MKLNHKLDFYYLKHKLNLAWNYTNTVDKFLHYTLTFNKILKCYFINSLYRSWLINQYFILSQKYLLGEKATLGYVLLGSL